MDSSVLVYIPFLGWGASAYRYIDRRIYEYPYIRYSLYASFFLLVYVPSAYPATKFATALLFVADIVAP